MTELVLDALAVSRLARFVVRDELVAGLRMRLIAWTLQRQHPRLRYLATCPHCVAPYLYAGLLVGKRLPGGRRARDFLAVLGAASLAEDFREQAIDNR